MTQQDHHLLCLGLLAKIAHDDCIGGYTQIRDSDYQAVREAIASAESIGLPVSLARFDKDEPISTTERN